MINRTILMSVTLVLSAASGLAQQPTESVVEQRVPLTQSAIAFDAKAAAALEGTLRISAINGAPDAPVKNVRLVIKNVSPMFYSYVSGWATFYDSAGIRCGEGLFKVDAITANESVETDTPGLRIACAPATWRIVVTNLLTRASDTAKPNQVTPAAEAPNPPMSRPANLVISIDGEEHPIQLDKPMILNLGDKQRTITVRAMP